MSESITKAEKTTILRNSISHLLEELTVDYQNTRQERKEIAVQYPPSDEQFSLLEELELLTVTIRGYASQIQAQGRIKNESEAIQALQEISIFEFAKIYQFYFNSENQFGQIKYYIRMLDYLRLLTLEYLRLSPNTL